MTHGHGKGGDEPDFGVVVGVEVVVVVEGVEVVVLVVVAGQILAGESWNLPSVIWLRRAASAHAVVHSVR